MSKISVSAEDEFLDVGVEVWAYSEDISRGIPVVSLTVEEAEDFLNELSAAVSQVKQR